MLPYPSWMCCCGQGSSAIRGSKAHIIIRILQTMAPGIHFCLLGPWNRHAACLCLCGYAVSGALADLQAHGAALRRNALAEKRVQAKRCMNGISLRPKSPSIRYARLLVPKSHTFHGLGGSEASNMGYLELLAQGASQMNAPRACLTRKPAGAHPHWLKDPTSTPQPHAP